jgi:choline dehydrogenase-like flavoprotein
MVIIEGYIRDTEKQPLVGIPVKAFEQKLPFDKTLTRSPQPTDNEGYFRIIPQRNISETASNVYIVVIDKSKKFVSVRDRHSRYKRKEDSSVLNWRGQIISNLNNIIEIVVRQEAIPTPTEYDSVVIGSGFGGTIVSLALAKMYNKENESKKVCILERGQWWISHVIPDSNPLRKFLVKNNMPFSTYPYPNDLRGMLTAIGNSRAINKVQGLFDLKRLNNVNVIAGSGVGGGSLVYFNITERSDPIVYENWPTEHDGIGPSLGEFYHLAERFIGVNPITSTAGLGSQTLAKAEVFQDAAKQIGASKILNLNDLDAKLSITDIPTDVFDPKAGRPNQEDIRKYSEEENICQRRGRCGLGCVPDSRHTLDNKLFKAIEKGLPIDIHPLCEVLDIEELPTGQGYRYAVRFLDYRDIIDKDDFSSEELTEQHRAELTKVIKTNIVVLAAGTLGSTELLLKSNKKLDLSNQLGSKFSTNGDFFGIINPTKCNVNASRGPTQTSIALFKDENNGQFAFSIEDVGIPEMFAQVFGKIFDIMAGRNGSVPPAPPIPRSSFISLFDDLVLKKMVNIDNRQVRNSLAKLIDGFNISMLPDSRYRRNLRHRRDLSNILSALLKFISSKADLTPEERVSNMLVLFGIGRDNITTSKLIPDDRNGIDLDSPYDLEQPIFKQILSGMKLFAQEIGKEGENSLVVPLWETQSRGRILRRQISAHPLGGCPMGDDASNGVVDSFGRVFRGKNGNTRYVNLYVADGSIIPTSLGVNPSLTITALAYRIAFDIVKRNRDYLP